MKIKIILLFLFYFCQAPVLTSVVTDLSKLPFHNEEFIPEDPEDSSTVHVGTAMFCQVGSEVCLHFEVNFSHNIYLFCSVLQYFPLTRFSSNRIFCGSHKWPRNTEQRRNRGKKDRIILYDIIKHCACSMQSPSFINVLVTQI